MLRSRCATSTGFTVRLAPIYATSLVFKLFDADLDGDFDLITAHQNNRNLLWLNDGDGNFTSLGTIFGKPRAFSIGSEDLDGDGDYDVVFGQKEGTGGNTIYFNE